MRIKTDISTILKAIGIELFILALIGLVFLFQFDRAKTDFVTKTRAIAETIGDQASDFFMEQGKAPTSDEFYMFLDKRLGRKKLFNTFEIAPKFFSVVFKQDIERGSASGLFMKEFYPEEGYTVKNANGVISVSVPFTTSLAQEPFGLVKINSNTKAILKKVFADNYLLYAAMLVVLNNQAFIFYLLMRRKREEVFERVEKGYLKEHSIGALKIMHKILGDIIEDHKDDDVTEEPKKKQDVGKNVIAISDLAGKRKG